MMVLSMPLKSFSLSKYRTDSHVPEQRELTALIDRKVVRVSTRKPIFYEYSSYCYALLDHYEWSGLIHSI